MVKVAMGMKKHYSTPNKKINEPLHKEIDTYNQALEDIITKLKGN
jgi:hypothetical protein